MLLRMLKRTANTEVGRARVRALNPSKLSTGEFTAKSCPLRDLEQEMHFRYYQMPTILLIHITSLLLPGEITKVKTAF